MGRQSQLLELLPEGYGYVAFVAVDSIFVNMWMARNVMKARKQYKIEYPTMYSPDNNTFNCIQRAHQQSLELHPTFLTLLLLGGIQHPKVATGAGLVYLVARVAYAKGYYSGDPKKRETGAKLSMLALLVLLGTTGCFAAHQLEWKLPAWVHAK